MEYKIIKNTFINFFKKNKHKIIPSFPIFLENDPSNFFVNAGMNPFKKYFLGYEKPKYNKIANIQRCLRVTGKHNDFKQVGYDNYHHTMFEMMGNWSFGDYSREKAIELAWNLLINIYNIPRENIYVTIFIGDKKNDLSLDKETLKYWKLLIPNNHILFFGKKDNFWEMGESGPCGPCTEIHVDLRTNQEKKIILGKDLINKNHPKVIEIWNLVFIEFLRKLNGELEDLSIKHVDTGMGLERLCMVLQEKDSSYETDIFSTIINDLKDRLKFKQLNIDQKISIQIVTDHLRAVIFSIFDGQIPSNNKSGYIIRKILRRAIIHINRFLDINISNIIDLFIKKMELFFPELISKRKYICDIIEKEEILFFNVIKQGNKKFHNIIKNLKYKKEKIIHGNTIFQLYDTYGYPIEIAKIIAEKNQLSIDENLFQKKLLEQKIRSKKNRSDLALRKEEWIKLEHKNVNLHKESIFIGYKYLKCSLYITKYRKVLKKNKNEYYYELVFSKTPFYPENGGQIADTGYIYNNNEKIFIFDTKKLGSLIVHSVKKLPNNIYSFFDSFVDKSRRKNIEKNHTSTHLLLFSLKKILGNNIEQKGSYIRDDYLRLDFSYDEKISQKKLIEIEDFVQKMIFINFPIKEKIFSSLQEINNINISFHKDFEKKYQDKKIRMISFGNCHELCIGTHVKNTGEIKVFKILYEKSISHGIRRIKALTSERAIQYLKNSYNELFSLKRELNSDFPMKIILHLKKKNKILEKENSKFYLYKINYVKKEFLKQIIYLNKIKYICKFDNLLDLNQKDIKNIGIDLINQLDNLFIFTGIMNDNKYFIFVFISDRIIKKIKINSNKIINIICENNIIKSWKEKKFSVAILNKEIKINNLLKKINKFMRSNF
ncbi:alanine--tRNA ligase [Blattabacterium cuenoti]|uniref:alanine--tRNA ligase n=1 Tax=Blattabacterium cuenoti TaxID=1653831 RepID=UPI00163C9888|nr:alanine--tRNA ligase [Blattabacterium cuenoti]